MKRINTFYIVVFILGIGLFFILTPRNNEDLSFYGFAESEETEINYNYPVVVDKILVTPGQSVKAGDLLMHLSRRQTKETMEDQHYRISELRADESIWRQRKSNQIDELALEKQTRLSTFDTHIQRLSSELIFKKSLTKDLVLISPKEAEYQPLEAELNEVKLNKENFLKAHDLKVKGLEKEIKLGDSPYKEQIKRLTAELVFEEEQKILPIVVTAPADGLIGNISCKEEEHIPSYTTLLSFYEPHSSMIQGFVHENLTLQVHIGDAFLITSLKDPTINYEGTVIGLGSRIVEIPTRLRKLEAIKSYGREVLVQISKENVFLLKEKVSLSSVSR